MTIHVEAGWHIPSGGLVEFDEHHVMVTGMTSLAGKTTAIEGIVHRWENVATIVFVTKRGEQCFKQDVKKLAPFLRQRADWRYLESLIEGTLQEKNRILRTTIMQVTKGAKSLEEAWRNVKHRLSVIKRDGFEKSMLIQLDEILALIVPQLAQYAFSQEFPQLDWGKVYVMDLSALTMELQAMVIGSVAEHIEKNAIGSLTVIPEAWEFLPNGRGTPAKLQVESLIRKGAVNRNWVVIDSQDIAGIHPPIRKQVGVWLLGKQSDALEAKRTIANIPMPAKQKPKIEDIQTLRRGNFYLVTSKETVLVYSRPYWMGKEVVVSVAQDKPTAFKPLYSPDSEDVGQAEPIISATVAMDTQPKEGRTEPETFEVAVPVKSVDLTVEERVLRAVFSDGSLEGMVCILIAEGFFSKGRTVKDTHVELAAKFPVGPSMRPGGGHAADYRRKIEQALDMLARKPYEVLRQDGAVFVNGKRQVGHRLVEAR
jgi:hypothetical protein